MGPRTSRRASCAHGRRNVRQHRTDPAHRTNQTRDRRSGACSACTASCGTCGLSPPSRASPAFAASYGARGLSPPSGAHPAPTKTSQTRSRSSISPLSLLPLPCFCCSCGFCGQDGRCFQGAPLGAAGGGRSSRGVAASGGTDAADPVAGTRICPRPDPSAARVPGGQDASRARPPRCLFFGYFLWTSKESDSAAAEAGETSRQDNQGREKPDRLKTRTARKKRKKRPRPRCRPPPFIGSTPIRSREDLETWQPRGCEQHAVACQAEVAAVQPAKAGSTGQERQPPCPSPSPRTETRMRRLAGAFVRYPGRM